MFTLHLSEDYGILKLMPELFFHLWPHSVSEKFYYNKYKLVYYKPFIFLLISHKIRFCPGFLIFFIGIH